MSATDARRPVPAPQRLPLGPEALPEPQEPRHGPERLRASLWLAGLIVLCYQSCKG